MKKDKPVGVSRRAAQVTPMRVEDLRLLGSPFLSANERDALKDALSFPKHVPRGKMLAQEGELVSALSMLVDGWACRCTTNTGGARQISALLIPGDVCNLDTLLFNRIDYDVRALTEVTVVNLSGTTADKLTAQYYSIAKTFTWLAMVENSVLAERTMSLGRRSSRERLAHLLCELGVRLGCDGDNATSFIYPLTQDNLADVLGLTPVHINRVTRELREDGLIDFHNRSIILHDVAELRRISGFDPTYLHDHSKDTACAALADEIRA